MGSNSIHKTVKSQYPDITIIEELQTSETKLTYMLNWLTDVICQHGLTGRQGWLAHANGAVYATLQSKMAILPCIACHNISHCCHNRSAAQGLRGVRCMEALKRNCAATTSGINDD